MEVLNYTDFKKDLKSSLDKVSNDEEIIIVSGSKNKNAGVVISLKEYNSLKETMYLLSTEKNRKRLQQSINEMGKGKFASHPLTDI